MSSSLHGALLLIALLVGFVAGVPTPPTAHDAHEKSEPRRKAGQHHQGHDAAHHSPQVLVELNARGSHRGLFKKHRPPKSIRRSAKGNGSVGSEEPVEERLLSLPLARKLPSQKWERWQKVLTCLTFAFGASVALAVSLSRLVAVLGLREKTNQLLLSAKKDAEACVDATSAHSTETGGDGNGDAPSADTQETVDTCWTRVGLAGPLEGVLFCTYSGLYLGSAILGHFTRDQHFSSAMLVLVTMVLKMILSIGIWRGLDGTFQGLLHAAWEGRAVLAVYAFPSACYAVGDTLRTSVLRTLPASTFLVLFNLRMFLLAFMWERLLHRKLQPVHWAALVCIFVGCVGKEMKHLGHETLDRERWIAYGQVIAIGGVNALAAVYNEKLLKYNPTLPVSLQNLAMYFFGSIWTALVTLLPAVLNGREESTSFTSVQQWTDVLKQPIVLTLAVIVALLGITTGYFLKRLSNIHREVAVAFSMVASLPIDALLFGYTVGVAELAAIGVVLFGIYLFAVNPVKA